jgi:hypothetical protein
MADNKWNRPDAPPPPLFTGEKEADFVKQINDEVIERVVGQQVLYFAISREHTNYHSLYGEAIEKIYYPPVRVYAQVTWGGSKTEFTKYGIDRRPQIKIDFHRRRLTEDQNLYVRVGDFVRFGEFDYEIVELSEPKLLFGQTDKSFEISATCILAREGKFNP